MSDSVSEINRRRLILLSETGLTERVCWWRLKAYGAIKSMKLSADNKAAFVEFECEHTAKLVMRCFEYSKSNKFVPMPEGVDAIIPGYSVQNFLILDNVPSSLSTEAIRDHFKVCSNSKDVTVHRPEAAASSVVVVELCGAEASAFHQNQTESIIINDHATDHEVSVILQSDLLTNTKNVFDNDGCQNNASDNGRCDQPLLSSSSMTKSSTWAGSSDRLVLVCNDYTSETDNVLDIAEKGLKTTFPAVAELRKKAKGVPLPSFDPDPYAFHIQAVLSLPEGQKLIETFFMTFRFLFPDPDQLSVSGPGNTTYWFMLLVRSDAIHHCKAIYYIAIVLEVIALVTGYSLHLRGLLIFWKNRAMHMNFIILTAGMYFVMIIGAIGRLLAIPYEMRLIQFKGLYESPIPFLAILRQASYSHAIFILWVWTIERALATFYVADYEKISRLHISILLNAIALPCSYASGYAIVTGVVNCFEVITLIPTISCAVLFRWLSHYNSARLARLTHHVERHPDEYTLSLRVQLKENVGSMKKIEFGVYLLTFGLTAGLAIVFVPIIFLTSPAQFETLQWITCAGNVAFALFILCSSPWVDVGIAMQTGKVSPVLNLVLGKDFFTKTVRKSSKKDIDCYFIQLDSQWSYGLATHR